MTAPRPSNTIRDRAHGCLLGVALGDSMGMPSELWPRERVVNHFGWIDEFLPGPDGHFVVDGFVAGQVTDDTQQTFMLAEAILDGGGHVRADIVAKHLVEWADRVGAVGGTFLGPSSARAIDRLRSGEPPRTTGSGGSTNGAAMRIAPVGIVRTTADLNGLVDAVVEASIMSHNTSVALSGAALIAGVISSALDNLDGDLDSHLAVGYRAAEIGEGRGELVVSPSVISRSEWAAQLARTADDDVAFLQQLYDCIGATVATSTTVPAAVGLLVRGGADPVKVATLSANLGGDTDTIGAIATGMAGAIAGASAIPEQAAAKIMAVNGIDPGAVADKLLAHRH